MTQTDTSKVVGLTCWLALVCTSACHEDPALLEPVTMQRGCFRDDQCESGEWCVFRLCNPSCKDGSCPAGSLCFELGRGSACLRVADNACVDTSDCPADASCKRGRCLSDCQTADRADCGECSGGLCHPGLRDAGVGDPPPNPDASMPAGCKPNATACRGNVVTRCDAMGKLRDEQSCPYTCKDGACSGSCRPGDQRCQERTRQSCEPNGSWRDIELCRDMCTPATCTTGCTDGARQCNGNSAQVCRRGQMIESERCEFVCRDGTCGGSCRPGSTQCRSNSAYTCDADGTWGMRLDCSNACVNGVCGGECAPGTQRCADERSYALCNPRGDWGPSVECREQACMDGKCQGECSPGDTRCESETAAAICQTDGTWGAAFECAESRCSDDRCAAPCIAGSLRCRPGDVQQPQICQPNGTWQDRDRCASNQACLSGGVCGGVCAPGTRRCDPLEARNTQTCSGTGQWGGSSPCPDDLICGGQGDCTAAPGCASDASPDWYSLGAGGDRSLSDPRWSGALDRFASSDGPGMEPDAGGYALVFDRASNELAVSLRALASDSAGPQDFAFFGIRANRDGEVAARAVRIPLAVASGADPRPLDELTGYTLEGGSWSEEPGTPDWVQNAAAWVMSPEASWAINFRVNLDSVGVNNAEPFGVALALHVENTSAEHNPATPASLMLGNAPMGMARSWPELEVTDIECTERVHLP